MRHLLYIVVFSSLILASSCVEDVLIEVEPAESKIVVSSLFIPDSIIIVTATRSFSALSGKSIEAFEEDLINSLLVDKALVTVSSNSATDTLQKLSPGVFIGSLHNPEPLEIFELNIYDSLTQRSVRSVTQLEEQVKFDSISVSLNIEEVDTTSTLYYQFRDPADQENWYLVQGFEFPTLPNFDNVTFDLENGDVVLEPDTSNQIFFSNEINSLFIDLISDITLKNDTIKGSKEFFSQTRDTVIFVAINIDEGYHDFLRARKRSGNIISSLFREPVNHPTNVENGYGYFTMHLPHFKAFIRDED
ncbi:MAG: DUF4249 family protein [Cyclobacteriaceae bacterium]